ncbi:long-chain fatty acid--CoA ligase [Gordonia jinhuaensis]|uniref:Acyl-CoA synthetase n=1 Tax=Gordonia jinhuaensis TaxID=1517702 RepID=A0A916SYE6_9ACTN|nr:long-chain fatty acid--CoA ligase [Gordonia jinhuaensis]GGB19017.1 putative long-chain-fatty-acid--CoA ligase FadD [Gordonia jinhuaensis]
MSDNSVRTAPGTRTEYSTPAEFTIDPSSSCPDIVFDIAKSNRQAPMFRRKSGDEWVVVTAGEAADQITTLAKGLIAQGVGYGDRVAMLSSTRLEWILLDFAIWAAGASTVPIYDSSSADQVEWILTDSGARALIVENDAHRAIVDSVGSVGAVEKIYQIDPAAGGVSAFDELFEQGKDVSDDALLERRTSVKAADPAVLIYTSGTTGRPKGCTLTHSNMLSECAGILQSSLGDFLDQPGRRTLMFLPLAHVLAHAVTLLCVKGGVEVGFSNDTRNIVSEFGSFKPDFILSVPRVFEKVYTAAQQSAKQGGKEKIFNLANDTAVEYSRSLDTGGPGLLLRIKHAIFAKLVYSKLIDALGGRCQLAISGGAPLGERLGHFFRGIGLPVYEGYGLTETTAAFGVNTPDAFRVGSVGRPLGGNSVRIAEDGEILLSGGVVFTGYWNNPEATKLALEDGWFHTGDIGTIDSNGFVSITGRKKEIIVTAGGKNVSPAGLEDVLRSDPLISQAVVVGDQKPFIGVLIAIDPEAFEQWKAEHGKPAEATVAELVEDPDLRADIDSAVSEANKTVSHAESIKKFKILPHDFTEETGEMTPTLKVKRNVVTKKYADEIESMYA